MIDKIAVITSGFLPVPATKGGAVENLIENFINMNEKYKDCELYIFSTYDDLAEKKSEKYNHCKVIFFKPKLVTKLLDKFTFFIAKNIFHKKNSHSFRFIFQRLDFLNQVSKNLNEFSYDKVLLENHPSQFLALKWRKNYEKYIGRYYYHCHNEFPGTYGCVEVMEKTNKFISVSEFRQSNIKDYLKFDDNKFHVLKNGIDVNLFTKDMTSKEINEIRKKYNINNDEKVLIFTGRLVDGKGVKELISSLNLVQYKNYKLLIVGASINALNVKNTYEEELLKLVEKVNEKVVFTGFIDYEDLYKLYKISDVAVLPSIIDDSAPLTIIESLVCGLPIITTNSGGIPEYVNDKCAIILDRDNDIINNLALTIDKLLNDDELLNRMSKESNIISKDLNLDVYYHNFVKLMVNSNE